MTRRQGIIAALATAVGSGLKAQGVLMPGQSTKFKVAIPSPQEVDANLISAYDGTFTIPKVGEVIISEIRTEKVSFYVAWDTKTEELIIKADNREARITAKEIMDSLMPPCSSLLDCFNSRK